MKDERWTLVKALVEEFLLRPPESRNAWLSAKCGTDRELHREVRSLIEHAEAAPSGFDGSVRARERRDSTPDTLPERIGPFRVIRRIGSGGMGTVYEAEQETPRRRVAVKTFGVRHPTSQLLRRFRREGEFLARLQHPGIAQIFEVGTLDGADEPIPYLAMELVAGATLLEFIEQTNPDTITRVRLIRDVCLAVEHAHENGVVHRDLKPENILVLPNGRPKVLDFGVARALDRDPEFSTIQTEIGQLVGTIPYMSPEQVLGEPDRIDARSDVYSLGVLLFRILAGKLPYAVLHRSIPEATRVICECEPERLSSVDARLRGDLDVVVATALEKSVERRYQSARDLADDLDRFLADSPISARPPNVVYRLGKLARRNKGLVGGIVATVLASVLGAVVALGFAIRSSRNEERALRVAANAHLTAALATLELAPLASKEHLGRIPESRRRWAWQHLAARLEPRLRFEWTRESTSRDPTGSVAFREDGRVLFACIDGRDVKLFDVEESRRLATLTHEVEMAQVEFSSDGSLLAVVSRDGERLVVWDRTRAAQRFRLDQYSEVSHPRFNASAGQIAFNTSEHGVAVVETEDGTPLSFATIDPTSCTCCRRVPKLDEHGRRFAATQGYGCRDGSARFPLTIRELDSGRVESRLLGEETFDLSPDFSLALSASGDDLEIHDLSTGERTTVFRGHEFKPRTASFSRDCRSVVSAALGEIRVWDTRSAKSLRVIGSPSRALRPVLSPDGSRVAAVSHDACSVWTVKGESSSVLRGHDRWVYSVAVSPDGSLVASGDFDGRVCLWDAFEGVRLAQSVELGEGVRGLYFSADGRSLGVTVTSQPNPRFARLRCFVLDLVTWSLTEPETGSASVSRVWRGAPRGARVGLRTENRVKDHDGSRLLVGRPGWIESAPIAAVETWRDGATDPAGAAAPRILARYARTKPPAIARSPDGSRIVSAHPSMARSGQGVLRLWDAASGRELRHVSAHRGEIYSVVYSPDGEHIVTGGNDRIVGVFHAETLDRVIELRGHEGFVRSVVFSPDGTRIVSASGDATVRIWDSVPAYQRAVQMAARRALRRTMAARFDEALASHESPAHAAESLWSDETLDPARRSAVLGALLRRREDEAPRRSRWSR